MAGKEKEKKTSIFQCTFIYPFLKQWMAIISIVTKKQIVEPIVPIFNFMIGFMMVLHVRTEFL